MRYFAISSMFFLFAAAIALAQITPSLSVSGRLSDSTTGIGLSGSYDVTFAIFGAAEGGTALFTDTKAITASSGVFSTTISPDLPFNADYWLELSVTGETLVPRQKITPAPYAIYANKAGDAASLGNGVVTVADGNVNVGGDLSVSGDLDVGGQMSIAALTSSGILQIDSPDNKAAYPISLNRYVVRATPAMNYKLVQLDHAIFTDLCGDLDGCSIIIIVKDGTSPGSFDIQSWVAFFYDASTGRWDVGDKDTVYGTIDNNADAAGFSLPSGCGITDADAIIQSQWEDNAPGFSMSNRASNTATCEYIISD